MIRYHQIYTFILVFEKYTFFFHTLVAINHLSRIPPELRDEWEPDTKLPKPSIDFDVEWVYGYRGKDSSGGRNIYQVSHTQIVLLASYNILNL